MKEKLNRDGGLKDKRWDCGRFLEKNEGRKLRGGNRRKEK